jgi:acetylornithine deacetylase/succinyl-diaminopimelate desuccinylase-like protein
MTTSPAAVAVARGHRDRHGAEILARFAELLAIPNTADDPDGLHRTAVWIRDALNERGARAALTALPDAPPVVTGRLDGVPGGPVIGVYAHYDGQPVDPARWSSPPFRPTLRSGPGGEEIPFPRPGDDVDPDWRVYARATADDRATIAALIEAIGALGGGHEATLLFLLEGEEERGSPRLGEYLSLLSDRLAADLWLVCDGPVHQSGRPQISLGVRGVTDLEIEVYGPPVDLHSGHYGNWAPNPADLLARLLATLRDDEGRLVVTGASGPEPDDGALQLASEVPAPPDMGFPVPGDDYAARLLRPLLNIRGLRSGDVGAASRNAVPTSAVASIDVRLVAGQDPEEVVTAIRRHTESEGFLLVDGPPDAETRRRHRRIARISSEIGYPGVRVPGDDPRVARAAAAVEAAAGEAPVVLPSFGGSVPIHHFVLALGTAPLILPIANHDNGQHGPDENIRIGNLWYGIDLYAALLGRVGPAR